MRYRSGMGSRKVLKDKSGRSYIASQVLKMGMMSSILFLAIQFSLLKYILKQTFST